MFTTEHRESRSFSEALGFAKPLLIGTEHWISIARAKFTNHQGLCVSNILTSKDWIKNMYQSIEDHIKSVAVLVLAENLLKYSKIYFTM